MVRLNAKQLRLGATQNLKDQIRRHELYIVLDNILDTYNIGSVFRLADAVAAKKIYLCGGTATPPNPRIKKASINTTEVVGWEYHQTALEAVQGLRSKVPNIQVVAIELTKNSSLFNQFDYKLPLCLVVGNETTGVSKEVLDIVDGVVELPMFGINISLNVMVSLGIVLYIVVGQLITTPD